MTTLTMTQFLNPNCNEHSLVENLKCVGTYYADCIEKTCGGRSLGHVVQYCSYKKIDELLPIIQACSRNLRGGEVDRRGHVIPVCNIRVWQSVLQLVWLARKNPELFPHYKVRIDVPSAVLRAHLKGPDGDASSPPTTATAIATNSTSKTSDTPVF
jgi:hypothetical protein